MHEQDPQEKPTRVDTPQTTLIRVKPVGAVPFNLLKTPLETWVPTQIRALRSWLEIWWKTGENRIIPKRNFSREELPQEAAERYLNEAREGSRYIRETKEIRQRRLLEDLIRPSFSKEVRDALIKEEAMLDYATIAERLRTRLEKEQREGTLTREKLLHILRHQRLKKIILLRDKENHIIGIRRPMNDSEEANVDADMDATGAGRTQEIALDEEEATDSPEIQTTELPRINKDTKERRHLLNEILESFGIEEYPLYVRRLNRHLQEDAAIQTKEAWKISGPEYQRLALMADLIIKNVLGIKLHPDIDGASDAKKFQNYIAEAKLETADDFHRFRSNLLKINVLFALQDILQRYGQGKRDLTRQLKYFSHQLDVLLSSIAIPTHEGYLLNVGSNVTIRVKDMEVSPGKSIESAVIKFLIRDEGHGQSIRDFLRCRVELHPDDCRTEEDIHAALEKVIAIILKALGTTTIQKESFNYVNIIPLEPGEENMGLEEFLERMNEKGIDTSGGEHGLSSHAYRGIQFKLTWHTFAPWKTDQHGLPAGIPQTIEVQVRMPTPDDHTVYKKKEHQRVLELFGFKKHQKEETYESVTFITFIKDLIHGLNTGEDPGGGHYKPKTKGKITLSLYQQTLLIVLRAIGRQEHGKLVNDELINALKEDKAVLKKLEALLVETEEGDTEEIQNLKGNVKQILKSETLPLYPYEIRKPDGTIEKFAVHEGKHYLEKKEKADGTQTVYDPDGSIQEEENPKNLNEKLFDELVELGKEKRIEMLRSTNEHTQAVMLPDGMGYYVYDGEAKYLFDAHGFDEKKIRGHILERQYDKPGSNGVVYQKFEYANNGTALTRTDYLATPDGTPDLGRYQVYAATDTRPWWNLGVPVEWEMAESYDRDPETGEPVRTTYRTNWYGKEVPVTARDQKSRWHF